VSHQRLQAAFEIGADVVGDDDDREARHSDHRAASTSARSTRRAHSAQE
jgi:hypothetical protein